MSMGMDREQYNIKIREYEEISNALRQKVIVEGQEIVYAKGTTKYLDESFKTLHYINNENGKHISINLLGNGSLEIIQYNKFDNNAGEGIKFICNKDGEFFAQYGIQVEISNGTFREFNADNNLKSLPGNIAGNAWDFKQLDLLNAAKWQKCAIK